MKRQSKADLILSEARGRLDKLASAMAEAVSAVRTAEAVYNAQSEAYYALERQLVPKPRKKAVKEVTPEKKEPMCAVCANPADHPDHDTTYLSSHPFALSVPKKSGRKSGEAKSTANTEAVTGSATAVGASGD